MCIVIDMNTLPSVIKKEASDHAEFAPVWKWIFSVKGTSVVYGGTKYIDELKKMPNYLKILDELAKMAKVKKIDTECVDREQKAVEGILDHPDFDDPHIVAIHRASGCLLFCTNDTRSHRFIRNNKLYPGREYKRPSIYSNHTNQDLLRNENIVSLRNVST